MQIDFAGANTTVIPGASRTVGTAATIHKPAWVDSFFNQYQSSLRSPFALLRGATRADFAIVAAISIAVNLHPINLILPRASIVETIRRAYRGLAFKQSTHL
jgi:hypothetical protein